jgi:hypothetical protein
MEQILALEIKNIQRNSVLGDAETDRLQTPDTETSLLPKYRDLLFCLVKSMVLA